VCKAVVIVSSYRIIMDSELWRPLLKIRKSCQNKLAKISKEIAENSTSPLDELDIEELREKLKTVSQDFKSTQVEIFKICPDDDNNVQLNIQMGISDKFEDEATENIKTLKILLRKLLEPTFTNPSSSLNQAAKTSDVKLPRLDLPTFDGKYEDWISFKDLFHSSVHNQLFLSDAQRLQYLKSTVKGEAFNLIKSFSITSANYAPACKVLQDRYENHREIINSILKRLLSQQPLVKESASGLQTLLDTTNECIRALAVLKRPVSHWDDILVYMVVERMDAEARRQWALSLKGTAPPTYSELAEFISQHVRGLFAAKSGNNSKQHIHQQKANGNANRDSRSTSSHHGATENKCFICKSPHYILECTKFKAMSPQERSKTAREKNLCLNCLKPGHHTKECKNQKKCKTCNKNHHTLLHFEKQHQNQQQSDNSTSTSSETNSSIVSTHFSNNYSNHVLLSTALVKVKDHHGSDHVLRVLLDNGSEASFITESCVQALGLSRRKANVTVSGISSSNIGHSRGFVSMNLSSCINNSNFEVEALILSKVTGTIPKFKCSSYNWSHIQGLKLADPQYYQPAEIDMLLGAEVADSIMLDGIIHGPKETPTARNSILGWIVSGKVNANCVQTYHVHHCEIDSILRKFWELEELPPQKYLNKEEKLCEIHFIKTQHRNSSGRFVLPLPFNEKIKQLGESRERAIRRLKQVERRIGNNQQQQEEYAKFMNEYIALQHMEKIPASEIIQDSTYYLPHHFVLKQESSTTNFRVVFDGSAKSTTGISLNNCLMAGTNVQDDLFALLLRFRTYPVALKADIGKMYRQFLIPKEEADYQRIVWRESSLKPIEDFRLLTLTYGTTSAAFLATRSLKQLAEDGKLEFPTASKALSQDFYVDDLMSGAATEAEAVKLQQQLCKLLQTAGMELRKWSSSHQSVIKQIPMEMREVQDCLELKSDAAIKALGIHWNPNNDTFSFSVVYPRNSKLTKRNVLSELAKVFDPLGWLSPVTINAKVLFQDLWKLNLGWDDELPENIQQQWNNYQANITEIKNIQIPRCIIVSKSRSQQLHAFCDASEKAYGAVLYLRSEKYDGSVAVHLITSKTRVAPIKQISLPRLELCGAVLLANLVSSFKQATNLNIQLFAWTDSTIVIRWLSAFPGRWKTFVANRVAEIQDLVPREEWRHVASEDNPADCISRGISPSELPNHSLWWSGPAWLHHHEFPTYQQHYNEEDVAAEEKASVQLCHHLNIQESLLSKYSSLSKLKRITAYIRRYFNNISSKLKKKTGFLTSQELQDALYYWIMQVQAKEFASDIKALLTSKELSTSSKIKQLNPFLDEKGMLRVGGRLQHSNVHEETKHQIILPSNNTLTNLIVSHYHLTNLHAGFQLLWASLQRRFWIVRARDVIRHQIRKCVICRRVRAETASQLMGSLPSARVNPGKPFNQTGLDFAGPFNIKPFKGRGNRTFKCYFVIFICLATKAVHLESVGEMTTEAFIGSLKRFVARRGLCSKLFSDCGTNLVGADKELQLLFKSSQHQSAISNHLANKGIDWHFNSPAAPHQGGLWEAGVKSVKYHLKRVIGNALLTLEEFNTVLCQVEGCLNSRPLCAMSGDPDDYSVLTPGHFLTGEALNAIPEPDLTTIKMNRLSRWQHTQQLLQHFWIRWSTEYLTSLQQRFKWIQKRGNLQVGDLVTIRDERLPPLKWSMGRIVDVHPGADSLVRVATVKTMSGELKRPIAKLCPILFKDEAD